MHIKWCLIYVYNNIDYTLAFQCGIQNTHNILGKTSRSDCCLWSNPVTNHLLWTFLTSKMGVINSPPHTAPGAKGLNSIFTYSKIIIFKHMELRKKKKFPQEHRQRKLKEKQTNNKNKCEFSLHLFPFILASWQPSSVITKFVSPYVTQVEGLTLYISGVPTPL